MTFGCPLKYGQCLLAHNRVGHLRLQEVKHNRSKTQVRENMMVAQFIHNSSPKNLGLQSEKPPVAQ